MTKPIPPLDLMWLVMETQASPTHVGAMLLFEKPKGRPHVVREIVEAYREAEPSPPFSYVPELGGAGMPYFREAASYDPDYHVTHLVLAEGLFARRPAAPRGRPARADARPRPAAVPQLAHRRRAGQPLRAVREGAPRHHRRRIGNEAHLRKPEHERPAHHSDSSVRDRGPGAQAASAESASWTAWRSSASPRRSRRSLSGTSRSARSARASPHCWARTPAAASRSRRSMRR